MQVDPLFDGENLDGLQVRGTEKQGADYGSPWAKTHAENTLTCGQRKGFETLTFV